MSDAPESPSLNPEPIEPEPLEVAAEVEDSPIPEAEAEEEAIVEPEPVVEVPLVAVIEPELPLAPVFTFTLGHAIWIAAGIIFAALRLGPTWQAPVGGAELLHLAGAWQANIGLEDSRYVPTFFQFLSSVLFRISDSEVPVRVLAFATTSSIPFALYRVRRIIGEPAALLALFVLAIDAATISLGSSGSAMGFDLAIATWLFAFAVQREKIPSGLLGILAFLCVTSGPVVLPVAFAIGLLAIFRQQKPESPVLIEMLAGAVFGIIVTSVAYGTGPITLRIAPIDLLLDSFDQDWSTMTTAQFVALYSGVLLLGGLATAAYLLRKAATGRTLEDREALLLAWFVVAAGWALAAAQSHSTAAAAALTLPAALLIGAGLAQALPVMFRADWTFARYLLPAAAAAALVAMNYSIDWARLNRVGSGGEQSLVILLSAAALLALFVVAYDRRSRPTLLAAALVVGILPTLSGAFGIGLSGKDEPVPSPRSTIQGGQLRDIALDTIAAQGGTISVHPLLEQAATWPFRNSGAIEVASQPSANATIVIWPAGMPAPEGYASLDGTWAFEESVAPPTDSPLRYLRWVTDRNTLVITPEGMNVYLKASVEGE